ncbi:hypothetical protein C3B79_2633 [Aeromonas hydrophila]|nr:hypothetical protein C3B79_2633 [Aeromonas hydrophila]
MDWQFIDIEITGCNTTLDDAYHKIIGVQPLFRFLYHETVFSRHDWADTYFLTV